MNRLAGVKLQWNSFDDLVSGGFSPEYIDVETGRFIDIYAEKLVDIDNPDSEASIPARYLKVLEEQTSNLLPLHKATEPLDREQRRMWKLIPDRALAAKAEGMWKEAQKVMPASRKDGIRLLRAYRQEIEPAARAIAVEPLNIDAELSLRIKALRWAKNNSVTPLPPWATELEEQFSSMIDRDEKATHRYRHALCDEYKTAVANLGVVDTGLWEGVTSEELKNAEAQLGFSFPDALRGLLSCFVGKPRDVHNWPTHYPSGYRFMSSQGIAEAYLTLKKLSMDGHFNPSQNWWLSGWVPFMEDLHGNYLCVDKDGYLTGINGQIIEFVHDGPSRTIWYTDLEQLFEVINQTFVGGGLWGTDKKGLPSFLGDAVKWHEQRWLEKCKHFEADSPR